MCGEHFKKKKYFMSNCKNKNNTIFLGAQLASLHPSGQQPALQPAPLAGPWSYFPPGSQHTVLSTAASSSTSPTTRASGRQKPALHHLNQPPVDHPYYLIPSHFFLLAAISLLLSATCKQLPYKLF